MAQKGELTESANRAILEGWTWFINHWAEVGIGVALLALLLTGIGIVAYTHPEPWLTKHRFLDKLVSSFGGMMLILAAVSILEDLDSGNDLPTWVLSMWFAVPIVLAFGTWATATSNGA